MRTTVFAKELSYAFCPYIVPKMCEHHFSMHQLAMPKKLPKGWVKTTLGEITEPSRARALPAKVPEMKYVGLEHIEPHTMRLLGNGQATDVRGSSVRFYEADLTKPATTKNKGDFKTRRCKERKYQCRSTE